MFDIDRKFCNLLLDHVPADIRKHYTSVRKERLLGLRARLGRKTQLTTGSIFKTRYTLAVGIVILTVSAALPQIANSAGVNHSTTNTLLNDSFDNFNNWTIGGTHSECFNSWHIQTMHDDEGDNGVAKTIGWASCGEAHLISQSMDTSDYTSIDIALKLYMRSNLASADHLKLQVKNFIGDWKTVATWKHGDGEDSDWHNESFTLRDSRYFHPSFQIRFNYRWSETQNNYASIDDVKVSALASDVGLTLRYGSPEDVSMDPVVLQDAVDRYGAFVTSGDIPGAVLLVARRGVVVIHEALGWRDIENRLPMETDALIFMRSNTKAMTSAALLSLVEAGSLSLDDRVGDYILAFADAKNQDILVRHLLTHTTGHRLPSGFIFMEQLLNPTSLQLEVARLASEIVPKKAAGETYSYTNLGHNTASALVEILSDESLGDFFQNHLYQPLGMYDSINHLSQADHRRMSKVYSWNSGSYDVIWQPGDPPTYPFVRGSGGMITTAWDFAIFCQTFLNGGVYGHKRILMPSSVGPAISPWTRSLYPAQQQADNQNFYGLGWFILNDGNDGAYHPGGYGTWAVIDPTNELLVLVLTQTTRGDRNKWEFLNIVREAIVNDDDDDDDDDDKYEGRTVLFSDTFDLCQGKSACNDGVFEKWTEFGSRKFHADYKQSSHKNYPADGSGNMVLRARYSSGESRVQIKQPIDTSSYNDIRIDFLRSLDSTLESNDYLRLQARANGGVWTNVPGAYWYGGNGDDRQWHMESFTLTDPKYMWSDFRIRFKMRAAKADEWIHVDDVVITGQPAGISSSSSPDVGPIDEGPEDDETDEDPPEDETQEGAE